MVKFFQLVLIPKAPLKMEFTFLTFFSLSFCMEEGKSVFLSSYLKFLSSLFYCLTPRDDFTQMQNIMIIAGNVALMP